MRYAIAALIAATIYLLRRGRRSWVESGPGAGALPWPYDDVDWLEEYEPIVRTDWQYMPSTWGSRPYVTTNGIPHLVRN